MYVVCLFVCLFVFVGSCFVLFCFVLFCFGWFGVCLVWFFLHPQLFKGSGSHLQSQNVRLDKNNGMLM